MNSKQNLINNIQGYCYNEKSQPFNVQVVQSDVSKEKKGSQYKSITSDLTADTDERGNIAISNSLSVRPPPPIPNKNANFAGIEQSKPKTNLREVIYLKIFSQESKMKMIAEKMKRDREFYKITVEELKLKNPHLYHFITNCPDKFYKLAESGKLDSLAQKKSSILNEDSAIRKVNTKYKNLS